MCTDTRSGAAPTSTGSSTAISTAAGLCAHPSAPRRKRIYGTSMRGASFLAMVLHHTSNLEELRVEYCEELLHPAQMAGDMRNQSEELLEDAIAGLWSFQHLRSHYGLIEVDINFWFSDIDQLPDSLDILASSVGCSGRSQARRLVRGVEHPPGQYPSHVGY